MNLDTLEKYFEHLEVNRFGDETEITGVKYFESWDIDDLEEPLHFVAVYKGSQLKSIQFPFSTLGTPDAMLEQSCQIHAWFVDKLTNVMPAM